MSTSHPSAAEGGTWVAGADGCKGGWFVVLWHIETGIVRQRTVPRAGALMALPEQPAVLGVDMVIGLPDEARPGGRLCDQQARRLLRYPRSSSVFSPPVQAALTAETFDEAQARQKATAADVPGLTIQAFHLLPKMRALDACMTPDRQDRVREVHPELSFYAMNGDTAVPHSKHTPEGQAARRVLLAAHGFGDLGSVLQHHTSSRVKADDVLDAYAACWTARRMHQGTAERLPPRSEGAPYNARGLRMEIWR